MGPWGRWAPPNNIKIENHMGNIQKTNPSAHRNSRISQIYMYRTTTHAHVRLHARPSKFIELACTLEVLGYFFFWSYRIGQNSVSLLPKCYLRSSRHLKCFQRPLWERKATLTTFPVIICWFRKIGLCGQFHPPPSHPPSFCSNGDSWGKFFHLFGRNLTSVNIHP
jgi:hypothetical protein